MITVGLYGIPTRHRDPLLGQTHDHGIALMRDGVVLEVVELERWTGRKHDARLPEFMGELLERFLPSDEPVRFASVNSFVGDTFNSVDGSLSIQPLGDPGLTEPLCPASVRWRRRGKTRSAEGWVVPHEWAHLGSLLPFAGAIPDGSLLAHIDGGASRSACSFWVQENGLPRLIESSWARLKAPVNNFNVGPLALALVGLSQRDHLALPGRLMGLAAWGHSTEDTLAWLLEHGWFLDHTGPPEALLDPINRHFRTELKAFNHRDPTCHHLAACTQRWFEDQVTDALVETANSLGATRLYLAGGAALNIPTNSRLSTHFDVLVVPPCTSDCGLALGAAAWVEACHGSQIAESSPFLHRFGTQDREPESASLPTIARALADGEVLGVCNGAAEVGPRALGHRSLLARPDSIPLRVRVSERCKQREWYRPVAPVVHSTLAPELIGDAAAKSHLARWMLGAWPVADALRPQFQGAVHADNTARVQVVDPDRREDAWLSKLLEILWENHGVAGLLNTSFNAPGAPNLQRDTHALPLARQLHLDGVVIQGALHRP